MLLLLLNGLPVASPQTVPSLAVGPSESALRDASVESALSAQGTTVATIERTLLALIAIAPNDDRFDLYRTYDELLGAWAQVDGLHTVLDRAAALASTGEDATARAELRDHAEFSLWELDSAIGRLADIAHALRRPDDIAANVAARDVLLRVRTTVAAILDDECARIRCSRIR